MSWTEDDHNSDGRGPHNSQEYPEGSQLPGAGHFGDQWNSIERDVGSRMHQDGRHDTSGIVVDPGN